MSIKPLVEAFTQYSPTGKSRTKYWPVPFVVVSRVAPVSTFLTLTVASWITAPDGSGMMPVMLLEVCAGDGDAKIRNDARSGRRRANVRRAEREADTSADDDCGFIDPPGRCGLRRADGPPRSMRAFLG